MELKKNTRWLHPSKSGGEAFSAKKTGKSGVFVVSSSTRGTAISAVQFKTGAKQVLELRKNTAKVIGKAISTPISDAQRARTKELADRALAAQASPATARFQR